MFIDTHCHLNALVKKEFDTLLEESHFPAIGNFIEQAKSVGVLTIINVGTSLPESLNSIAIAKKFPNVFATVGLHPCDCTPTWRDDFKEIAKLARGHRENKIVGIGEVGLDFYHKPFDKQRQVDAFKMQIELALECNLALVVHVREAADELLRILEEYRKEIKRAVIHCFCQEQYVADTVIDWGFFIGIDAPLTYPKNELLRSVVTKVPLTSIVLETDSPFLPPQSHRGKQNAPAYIPLFVPLIAQLKGVSIEEVGRQTTLNAKKLFSL